MNKTKTASDYFDECFGEGEEVVIITDHDTACHGVIQKFVSDGIELHWNGKTKLVKYSEMRFISHDGFPVKQLLGADGSSSIEMNDSKSLIRSALFDEFAGITKKVYEPDWNKIPFEKRTAAYNDYVDRMKFAERATSARKHKKYKKYFDIRVRSVIGDPFILDGFYIDDLLKPDIQIKEPSALLVSQDEAWAMLWHFPSIYHMEFA